MLEIDDLLTHGSHLPDDISSLRVEQGNLSRADQQFEWAIACFDAALTIKPDNHAALNNKGVALKNLGRYVESTACMVSWADRS